VAQKAGLGVVSLRCTRYFLERVVHGLAALPGKRNHLVRARRCTTNPKTAIALGHQAARDRVEYLVERGIADDPRARPFDQWKRVVDINLTGSFLGARAAARVMGEGGRIVFTGSVLGERPRAGLAAYSASKAGLVGLAKSLALDLAPSGITVNVVAPGWFDSPLAEGWKKRPELAAAITGHTAQQRWGASSDLAGAYQFLASDASAFVTGTVLNVDGGYLLV